MAGSDNFTGQNIQDSYQRVLQLSSSGQLADGTGSLVPLLDVTASFAVSASVEILHEVSSSHAQQADSASYVEAANINQPFTDITSSGGITSSQGTGSFEYIETSQSVTIGGDLTVEAGTTASFAHTVTSGETKADTIKITNTLSGIVDSTGKGMIKDFFGILTHIGDASKQMKFFASSLDYTGVVATINQPSTTMTGQWTSTNSISSSKYVIAQDGFKTGAKLQATGSGTVTIHSGSISASAEISSSSGTGSFEYLFTSQSIHASGDISSSGNILTEGNITASGGISASGTGSFQDVTISQSIAMGDRLYDPNNTGKMIDFSPSTGASNMSIRYNNLKYHELQTERTIFNYNSQDWDSVFKGDSDTTLFYIDAGQDKVAVGEDPADNDTSAKFNVVGDMRITSHISSSGEISSSAGSGSFPNLWVSQSAAIGDDLTVFGNALVAGTLNVNGDLDGDGSTNITNMTNATFGATVQAEHFYSTDDIAVEDQLIANRGYFISSITSSTTILTPKLEGSSSLGDQSGSLVLSGSLTLRPNDTFPADSGSTLYATGSGKYFADQEVPKTELYYEGMPIGPYTTQMFNCGWQSTTNVKVLLPFAEGGLNDLGASTTTTEYSSIIMPFDGYVDQVLVRSENDCGNVIVGTHISVDTEEMGSITAGEAVTIDMSTDDTTRKFGFSSSFAAGNTVAISFDPVNTGGDCVATLVVKFDMSKGL